MELNWKVIFTLQLVLFNLTSIYGQGTEEYIELTKRTLVQIEKKIDQEAFEIKKLIFKCTDDPFDGNVIYYHSQNKIEKVAIEYYYEGIYKAITYYLKDGELVFQEIRENMEMGEYDEMTGRGVTTEEQITRIYIESFGHNSKRCIVTDIAEALVLKEYVDCEIFDEDYYKQVMDFFRLDANSKVCLIYD